MPIFNINELGSLKGKPKKQGSLTRFPPDSSLAVSHEIIILRDAIAYSRITWSRISNLLYLNYLQISV